MGELMISALCLSGREKWKNCLKSLNEGFGFRNSGITSAQWIFLNLCMPKKKTMND